MDNIQVIEDIKETVVSKINNGLIAIIGQGAAGKTRLSHDLASAIGRDISNVYHFDDLYYPTDYRRGLKDKEGNSITGCHPKSFNGLFVNYTFSKIKRGQDVPRYKSVIEKGKLNYVSNGNYEVKQYNIIEGLPIMLNGLEGYYDYKIFLECDFDIEKARRLERDTTIKQRPVEEVKEIFAERLEQYNQYILPFRDTADMIVRSNEDCSLEILKK